MKAGDRVLVLGISGVSIYASNFSPFTGSSNDLTSALAQIAVVFGAKVIIPSSSDEKLQPAIELGATYGVNYKKTYNWNDTVHKFIRVYSCSIQHFVLELLYGADKWGRGRQCSRGQLFYYLYFGNSAYIYLLGWRPGNYAEVSLLSGWVDKFM